MASKKDKLEWEFFEQQGPITNVTCVKGLYDLKPDSRISIQRNDQYDLIVTISGVASDGSDLEPNIEKIDGAFIKKDIIEAQDNESRYVFDNIALDDVNSRLSLTTKKIGYDAILVTSSVTKIKSEEQATILNEWYLGAGVNAIFPRTTSRKITLDDSYIKVREEIDDRNSEMFRESSTSRDFFHVTAKDFSCIVAKAAEGYGPEWSFNYCIEYRSSLGKIPNSDEREAVSEIVSFILGNQLLKIGETAYDAENNIVYQQYQSPWGDNVMSRCQSNSFPPVYIRGGGRDWFALERVLNTLIDPYIEKRASFELKDALWKYWIAGQLPIGVNLPILAGGLEVLTSKILKAHPEIKHYYISFEKFCELISDEIMQISTKIGEHPNSKQILNKIKGASQRSINEKIPLALEQIGLPIKTVEKKAIQARNKMTHSPLGQGDSDDTELIEIVRHTRAYQTLFNRTLLKILGYQENYIDYYTYGHPERDIDIPIE